MDIFNITMDNVSRSKKENKLTIYIFFITLVILFSTNVYSSDIQYLSEYKTKDFAHLIDTNADYIVVGDYSGNIYLFDKKEDVQWKHTTDGVPLQLKIIDNKIFIFVEKEKESIPTYFLYILDLNGKLLKKQDLDIRDTAITYVNSAIINNDYLIVATYDYLHFFDIDGKLKAKYNYKGIEDMSSFDSYLLANSYDYYTYLLNMGGDVLSTYKDTYSAVTTNNHIVTSSKNGSISFFPINNILSSKYKMDHPVMKTLPLNGGIVVGMDDPKSYNKGYIYYLKNNNINWKHEFDGYVLDYYLVNEEQIAIILSNGKINIISKEGNIIRKFDIKDNISSTYGQDNLIVVGTKDTVHVLNDDGEIRWSKDIMSTKVFFYSYGKTKYVVVGGQDFIYFFDINGNLKKFHNINGSVTSIYASNGYVGVGTKNEAGGGLYFFDDQGKLKWNYSVDYVMSIDISADYVAVGCKDIIGAGSIYLFDTKGTLKWEYSTDARAYPVYLHNDYLIVGLGENLMIFNISGEIIMKYPLNDFFISFNILDEQIVIGSMGYKREIKDNVPVYNLLDFGYLYFLDINAMIDTSPKWKQQINCTGFLGCGDISMSASDDYLAVVSEYKGEVYLFDADGTLKWIREIEKYPIRTKQIKMLDKYVIVGTGDGCYETEKYENKKINCDGSLYIFDINGTIQLKQNMGEITKIGVLDDYIIIGSHKKSSDDYLSFFLLSPNAQNSSFVSPTEPDHNLFLSIALILIIIILSLIVIWHKKFK